MSLAAVQNPHRASRVATLAYVLPKSVSIFLRPATMATSREVSRGSIEMLRRWVEGHLPRLLCYRAAIAVSFPSCCAMNR